MSDSLSASTIINFRGFKKVKFVASAFICGWNPRIFIRASINSHPEIYKLLFASFAKLAIQLVQKVCQTGKIFCRLQQIIIFINSLFCVIKEINLRRPCYVLTRAPLRADVYNVNMKSEAVRNICKYHLSFWPCSCKRAARGYFDMCAIVLFAIRIRKKIDCVRIYKDDNKQCAWTTKNNATSKLLTNRNLHAFSIWIYEVTFRKFLKRKFFHLTKLINWFIVTWIEDKILHLLNAWNDASNNYCRNYKP